MRHGESSAERLRSLGGSAGGHVALSRLFRRLLFIGGKEIHAIEDSWLNSQGPMWSRFAREALGEAPSMIHASRSDLYRVCRLAVRAIDAALERGAVERNTWYPDGWREAYDAVKASERGEVEPEPEAKPAEEERPYSRHDALDAVSYVAEKLRVSEGAVLEMLGQHLHTLNGEHYRAALELLQNREAAQ